ncbi:hypothetical protein MTO96_040292 [Rhipicephalus appendiculatus]
MTSRELDIVLFGATGVTGLYVVEELHRSSEGLRWGVAGRNADKLRSTLREAAKNLSLEGKAGDRPAEVSALFAQQFSSIYVQAYTDDSELLEKFSTRDKGQQPIQLPDDLPGDSLLLSATFSPEVLSSAISKISPSPSPGPDGMAPTFFQQFAPRVLLGFRHDRSCDTALTTLNHISHNLEDRIETDLIQPDLSNAFDTLNISLLLNKWRESEGADLEVAILFFYVFVWLALTRLMG